MIRAGRPSSYPAIAEAMEEMAVPSSVQRGCSQPKRLVSRLGTEMVAGLVISKKADCTEGGR